MQTDTQAASVSKKRLWAGRIISGLLVLFLLFNGAMASTNLPSVKQGFAHLGYPESLGFTIGTLLLACTALYAIPRTSVLGAILLTGYLGGATASQRAHRRSTLLRTGRSRRAGLGRTFLAR